MRRIRVWLSWITRKHCKSTIDYIKGAGYYCIPSIGGLKVFDLTSGKKGVFKLIDVDYYADPNDMIKKSYWEFIGYADKKPLKEMSFKEYYSMYLEQHAL